MYLYVIKIEYNIKNSNKYMFKMILIKIVLYT